MTVPPAGLAQEIWDATHPRVQEVVQALQGLQQENEQLREQLAALATEVARLKEQRGRNSRNSSKPPSSDGPGFQNTRKGKGRGTGRQRGGQKGHPGSGRELLPSQRCDDVIHHLPSHCRRCGTGLSGDDPEPLRHQVWEIPPITLEVIEHQLHRLSCPCCGTSTCAELPPGVETSGYGPRLSGLVGMLGASYPLSIRKVQALLDQLLGVRMSTGALLKIRQRISDVLAAPVAEALAVARSQPVVHMDETSAPTGNADGANPDQRKGWLWVLVTPALTVFQQGLRRSRQAAEMLLGETFAGILVSDRYSVYSLLPNGRRQLCWAHIRRDLIAIVERSGASAQIGAVLLDLQRQLFDHWYQWRDGLIAWPELQQRCGPIRRQFEAQLEAAADLGCARKETTPVARTVGTCRELLKAAPALWTFLDHQGVEPTNNAAERALRLAVIQRKISHGVQSARGALCRARLLTVTTSLRQQGRDVWEFLEQAWVAHRHGGVMPSLVPDEIRQGSVATLAVND